MLNIHIALIIRKLKKKKKILSFRENNGQCDEIIMILFRAWKIKKYTLGNVIKYSNTNDPDFEIL